MDREPAGGAAGKIACILITHLRAKLEIRRNPQLRDQPAVITDRSQGRTLVIDHFPAAQGVTPGMTPEQALSRQAGGKLMEADEPHYRREFHRVLEMLQGVSDRVEGAELGTAYVGLNGLEALYGGEARLVNTLLNAVPQDLAPRAGVGHAKFPAYVAARNAAPMGAARVPSNMAAFLAPHQVELLPLSRRVLDDLHRLGLHTLGDVAVLNIDAMTDRFGTEGRRAWELAQGIDETPLIPIRTEERIVQQTALPMASGSLDLLLAAVDTLLRRAYAQPRMQGRYAGHAALECALYRSPPWERQFHFKQAVGDWGRASRILRGQMESDHPQAPVEEATLALSGITRESGVQMNLLPNQRGDLERRLDQAERQLQARTGGRPVLHRIIPVAHWHPAPELRAMQVPLDPANSGGMRQLSLPHLVTVREGPEGEPLEVFQGGRWRRVARTLDTWCFDLWWMPTPLTRTYYRVEWDMGGDETLFRDGREDQWYQQDP
ncbi:MAG: hypothetical protein J4G03_08925 [Gemmatimonadetes bacterium]|nr:hypothetical protein [Gemmatimonadota bacterium]